MNKVKAVLHNRFDFEVNGEWIGYAENIVLNQALTRLANNQAIVTYITLGKGAGTPVPERTGLFTPFATHFYKTPTTVEIIYSDPGKAQRKMHIAVNPSELVGETITEVGIAYGTTNTTLATHAMLKDAEGNHISILKTATDVINVYATIYAEVICADNIMCLSDRLENQTQNGYVYYANTILLKLMGLITDADATYFKLVGNKTFDGVVSLRVGNTTIPTDKYAAAATFVSPYSRKQSLRYEVSEGNMEISSVVPWKNTGIAGVIGNRNCASFAIKTNTFQKDNLQIGTGDGACKKFKIPLKYPLSILDTKVNGIVLSETLNDNYSDIITQLDCWAPINIPVNTSVSKTSGYSYGFAFNADGTRAIAAFNNYSTPSFICLYEVDYVNNKLKLLDWVLSNDNSGVGAYRYANFINNNKIVVNCEIIKIVNDKFTDRIGFKPVNTSQVNDILQMEGIDVFVQALYISSNYKIKVVDVRTDTPVILDVTLQSITSISGIATLKINTDEFLIFVTGNNYINILRYIPSTNTITLITARADTTSSIQIVANKIFIRNTIGGITALREYAINGTNNDIVFVKDLFTPSMFGLETFSSGITSIYLDDDTFAVCLGSPSITTPIRIIKLSNESTFIYDRRIDLAHTQNLSTTLTYQPQFNFSFKNWIMLMQLAFGDFTSNNDIYLINFTVIDLRPNIKEIEFAEAPANGLPVTTSVIVSHIPKNANYVVDIEYTVTYGEGV